MYQPPKRWLSIATWGIATHPNTSDKPNMAAWWADPIYVFPGSSWPLRLRIFLTHASVNMPRDPANTGSVRLCWEKSCGGSSRLTVPKRISWQCCFLVKIVFHPIRNKYCDPQPKEKTNSSSQKENQQRHLQTFFMGSKIENKRLPSPKSSLSLKLVYAATHR
jgi:hypothetical protein